MAAPWARVRLRRRYGARRDVQFILRRFLHDQPQQLLVSPGYDRCTTDNHAGGRAHDRERRLGRGCVNPGNGSTYCGQAALDWCNQSAGNETYVQGEQRLTVYTRDGTQQEPTCEQDGGGPDCNPPYCRLLSSDQSQLNDVSNLAGVSPYTSGSLQKLADALGTLSAEVLHDRPLGWPTDRALLSAAPKLAAESAQLTNQQVADSNAQNNPNADIVGLGDQIIADGNAAAVLATKLTGDVASVGSRC